jgi:hypothetical protein
MPEREESQGRELPAGIHRGCVETLERLQSYGMAVWLLADGSRKVGAQSVYEFRCIFTVSSRSRSSGGSLFFFVFHYHGIFRSRESVRQHP